MYKTDEFLKELKELYEKHKIVIDACGCCNSPFLIIEKVSKKDINKSIEHLREDLKK